MTHFPASCVTKIESQLGNLLLSSGHEGMKPQAEVRSGELWGAGTPSLFFPLWAAPSLDPVIAMLCRVVTVENAVVPVGGAESPPLAQDTHSETVALSSVSDL